MSAPRRASSRSLFRSRFLSPLRALAVLGALACAACGGDAVREAGLHDDGTPAYEREYALTPGGVKVPHGAHATWYPGGTRRTLEFFRRGLREGFAFEWDESGTLIRMESCAEGQCEIRALPDRPIASALALAETRFR